MSTRILVLTAGFGEGHNAAARNLEQAFGRVAGPDSARVVDVLARSMPRLNRLARRTYLTMINRTPSLWNRLYARLDRLGNRPRGWPALARGRRWLEMAIERERPDAICCTYPLYAYMLQPMRGRGKLDVPCFNVVTDSISIHSFWWRAPCSGWFVPNEDSARVLEEAGVDRRLVHDCGFPTPLFCADHAADLAPPDPARERPRLLLIINTGVRRAEAIARSLFAVPDWDITCAVGRHQRLQRRLEALAADRGQPTTILGWTEEIPRLLMTHHLVISKAGGATTQEAIATRCPMIVTQIVPGQEEGNYELLRRYGAGTLAERPEEIVQACRRALSGEASLWRQWREALTPLARPLAAVAIAEHVLAAVEKNRSMIR